MNATHFKITARLVRGIRDDLRRPHPFAFERVGFILCRFSETERGLLILAHDYHAVAEADYIDDPAFGALIGSGAFRKAMQLALSNDVGLFHVHLHGHAGPPRPSSIDLRETKAFVQDFFHVRPFLPHGAVILSNDSISGRIWPSATRKPVPIDRFTIVGAPQSFEISR